jgi:hypothetical protein
MELSTYPRHRLRSFQTNNARFAATALGTSKPVTGRSNAASLQVTRPYSPKEAKQADSLGALADAIFDGAEKQSHIPTITPVASSSQASRLNMLFSLDATADSAASTSHQQGQEHHKPIPELARNRMHLLKRKTTNRNRLWQRPLSKPPDTQSFGEGHRVESYENGARVMKDELGRVVEVSSQTKQQMFITYSKAGFLSAFCLLDPFGNVLLVGEHDDHGVVVKGPKGQLQAVGEYMSVGPNGCLTVHRLDGQFWSIDLVLSTFTERRFMVDSDKRNHCLTAIFSDDGFRMMTRFQALPSDMPADAENPFSYQGNPAQVTLRFYGRDGSMIEFDSDENLESVKPSLVQPAAKQRLHGKRNNRTAWDAVERYLEFASYRT